MHCQLFPKPGSKASYATLALTLLILFSPLEITRAADESPSAPLALYLTWQQDPTTTMTVDWHVGPEDDKNEPMLHYKQAGSEEWKSARAYRQFFPYSNRTINRVEITGLQPDTYYRFRADDFTREYSFRTMPDEPTRTIRFAAGGDTDHVIGGRSYKVNQSVMEYDPDFIVWGGDLAYADGGEPDRNRVDRWYGWFDVIKQTLITEEGRVVPIISGIGNHEVKRYVGNNQWHNFDNTILPYDGTDRWRMAAAPIYYSVIAFPGLPGYGVLDFGNYMSLIILDTGHTNRVEGPQLGWLEEVLTERDRRKVDYIYPVYHNPGFPSHRSPDGRPYREVRDYWVPLFEQSSVQVAFENHDHTYKRTHPIRNGQVSEDGIVYIGDGNWGRRPREIVNKPGETWYMKVAESVNNAIIVTIDEDGRQHFLAIDENGDQIDEYEIPSSVR